MFCGARMHPPSAVDAESFTSAPRLWPWESSWCVGKEALSHSITFITLLSFPPKPTGRIWMRCLNINQTSTET